MSKINKNELNQLFKERNTLIKQKFNEYHANRKDNSQNTMINIYLKSLVESQDEMFIQLLEKLDMLEK